jgi:hypothetical protein
MWIDVGKLIREHVPDKNGKTLPADLTMGSYEFRDLTNKGVGTLFEGKIIYDKTYGHVVYGCGTCCGYGLPKVFYDPLGVPMSATAGQGATAYENCYRTWDDVSDSFWNTWTSNNTALVTVDYYGTHTGHSQGSTSSYALAYLDGTLHAPSCPRQLRNPNGGVHVQVPTSLSVLSDTKIIDMSYAGGSCSNTGSWGILIAIHYQVLDQNGLTISSFQMEPQEKDPNLGIFNWTDIGPSNYPGTAKFTDVNGQFWDAPLGVCSAAPFTESDTQTISILFNGTRYPVTGGVRTNAWSVSSSFPGHGTITNGQDVSKSR